MCCRAEEPGGLKEDLIPVKSETVTEPDPSRDEDLVGRVATGEVRRDDALRL